MRVSGFETERQRERERETERERQRERQRQRQRQRETETETERDRDRERQRQRERETERERERERGVHFFTHCSVTRWLDQIFHVCPLVTMKMCPIAKKIFQNRFSFLTNIKPTLKQLPNVDTLAKFRQIRSHCICTKEQEGQCEC